MSQFKPLALSVLKPQAGYFKPYFSVPNMVKANSSALEVMTDLRYAPAVTVTAIENVEAALQKMIFRGVRSLLVVDQMDDVIGIITARDLTGERLAAYTDRQGVPTSQVAVGDVMTPKEHIEVLPLADVLLARVGDIIETLKHSHRQHALVAEDDPVTGKQLIRGIFSATQIARQLAIPLKSLDLDYAFSELESILKK